MIASLQEFDAKAFVKVRASLDASEQSFLTWSGAIYAFVPKEKRKHLFDMVGMSVSRCITREDGVWDFTSRELTYYLEPSTGDRPSSSREARDQSDPNSNAIEKLI